MDKPLASYAHEVRDVWARSEYYAEAEAHMDQQWADLIYPAIQGSDFTRVLELAPGHGRNSEKLLPLATELHLVDANTTCINACKQRFDGHELADRLHYWVNDGSTLSMFEDASLTFAYCWDAMVHFEPPLVENYINELARVLAPGARAALHYSNYRALHAGPNRPWRENPHWRSEMSRSAFHEFCASAGLVVEFDQYLTWDAIADLDVAAVLRKPGG